MFEQSLRNVGSNRYLGSAEVVDQLVRKFFGRVLELKSKEDLVDACDAMAHVFSGLDKSYQQDKNWAGPAGLAQALNARYGIDDTLYEYHLMQQAFAHFAKDAMGIVQSGKEQEAKIDKLINYATCLLIGTVDVEYPHSSSWQSYFDA